MINFSLLSFLRTQSLVRASIIALTLWLAYSLGTLDIAPSRLLIFLLAAGLLCVLIIARSIDRALWWGYLFWIATLAVGWRGLWITPDLRFYAPEMVIWLLFALKIFDMILQRARFVIVVPGLLLVLIVGFGTLGLFTAFGNHAPWDALWAEYKNWVVLIPVFAVTFWIITDIEKWKRTAVVFIMIMTAIAILGLLEYVAGVSLNIFGSTDVSTSVTSQLGFVRATFTFWGHPSVSFLLVLTLGFVFPLLAESRGSQQFWGWIAVLLLSGGIYVSGTRGMWLATGLFVVIYALLDLPHRGYLIVPYAIGLLLVPGSFYNNLLPILYGVDQYYDSSIENRVIWSNFALSIFRKSPWVGLGWGNVGWLHNDFLQLGAVLGLPAMAVFILWYVRLGWSLLRMVVRKVSLVEHRRYGAALLAVLVGMVVMVSSQVIMPLTPLAVGFWCFTAMAMRYVTLASAPPSAVLLTNS